MKKILALSLSIFWFGFAHAEPIRVQTGEHVDFTRVVLNISPGSDWRIRSDDDGYAVRVSQSEGYDTSSFFDLIPRNRIVGVSQDIDAGELMINLGCTCVAKAFLDQPSVLVIDIRDGDPTQNTELGQTLEYSIADKTDAREPQLDRGLFARHNALFPLIFDQSSSVTPPQKDASIVNAIVESPINQPNTPIENSNRSDLAALEQSVTESLGRAMSQGLLETDLEGEGTQKRGEAKFDSQLVPGLRTSTSVDQAAIPDDPLTPVTQQGDPCIPSSYFDVASWGDSRPYATQIGAARAQLTSEFDLLDENAVTTLARVFIYFGFGREAVQVLNLDGVQSQERRYLTAIAKIIDGDPLETALFENQVSCASEVALWAALAFSDGSFDSQLDRPAVLRSFKLLPSRLQTHLAPRLAERFVKIGDNDAAFQAINVVRTMPSAPLEVDMAEVSLSRALGNEENASERVAKLVNTNVRVTPEVMIDLFNDAVRYDRKLNIDDFILADALRFENGRSPVAADLAVAQVRAQLHATNFEAALRLMHEEIDGIGPSRSAVLLDEFAQTAVKEMPDSDFLTFAFEAERSDISPQTENALAKRLLDLGFAERANEILASVASGPAENERSYLRAEVALELDRPEQAKAILEGQDSEHATTLREIADTMQTTNGAAAARTRDDNLLLNQWRLGEWSDLAVSDDPLLQAASMAVTNQADTSLNRDTPLASGRALLSQSVRSRMLVEDLLERFSGPTDF